MSNLNLDLTLQFHNQGGAAAQSALQHIAQIATQAAGALTGISQSAAQSSAGLRRVSQIAAQSASSLTAMNQAASQSGSHINQLGQSAAHATQAQRGNANAALQSAAALHQLTNNSSLSSAAARNNAQAALQSAASLRDLTASASAHNAQMRQAAVEMAQLIATTRQATAAQLALSQAMQGAQNQTRNPQANPLPWLPQALRDSRALQATWAGMRTGAALVGAGLATKAAVAPDFNQVMAYDLRLAHAANTAYMTQGTAARQAGAKTLNDAVMAAVRQGGGTRDTALDAADSMIARGAIGSTQAVYQLLPMVTKTATAGNTGAVDIARIVSAAVKQGEIAVPDIGKGLGMALYAGQIGGFELRDMAKWLPQHITMASMAGIRGQSGMAKILALSQMAINSAGTQDEAGNNVRDFLHELNAQNTANHLKRFSLDKNTGHLVEHHGRGSVGKGRDYINLGHTLAANREKGIDAIDSIIGITRQIAESDPKFRAAQARYSAAKANGDKGSQLESTRDVHQILMSRGVGKLFANQQSLMGGINAIMNPDEYHRMTRDIEKNGGIGSIDANYATIAATASHKVEHKQAEEANALQTGLQSATGWLGKYADTVADLYKKNPILAASIETMTTVVKGATAAIGVMAGAALLSRGLGAAGAAGAGGLLGGLTLAGAGALALKGGAVTAAGAAGYAVGHYAVAPAVDWITKTASGGKNDNLGGWMYDLFNNNPHDQIMASHATRPAPLDLRPGIRPGNPFSPDWTQPATPDPAARWPQLGQPGPATGNDALTQQLLAAMREPKQPVQVTTQLHLDGHQIATVVNDINGRNAARH